MKLTPSAWTLIAVFLLWLLTATGCASPSPTMQPVVAPPRVPPPPVTSGLPGSGAFWTTHCELLQRAQTALNVPLPMPGFCSEAGPPSE